MPLRAGIDTDLMSDEHSEIDDRPVTGSVTAQDGGYINFPKSEHSELADRPVMESVTTGADIDTDFISKEDPELVDRPVMELVTARNGNDTDFPSKEHSKFVDKPVTESVSGRAGIDTDYDSDEQSTFLDRPAKESVTARVIDPFRTVVVNGSIVVTEDSELRGMVLCETNKRDIPVIREKGEGQRIGNTAPVAFQQIDTRTYHYHGTNVCFAVCGTIDSANCPETCSGSCEPGH